ncbi:hypothetical protein GBA52_023305 [Prunus armeniaca]|nr:hypothetical protein GBA52_023305 [Prunus armeniaca]
MSGETKASSGEEPKTSGDQCDRPQTYPKCKYREQYRWIYKVDGWGEKEKKVETEMECVEAALKTSIRKEMAVKASPQAVFDDLLWGGVNGQNGVACDDFSVDDLLDFSNEDGFVETEAEEDDKDKVKGFASVSPPKQPQDPENSDLSDKNELGPEPTSELSVPGSSPRSLRPRKRPDPAAPLPEKTLFQDLRFRPRPEASDQNRRPGLVTGFLVFFFVSVEPLAHLPHHPEPGTGRSGRRTGRVSGEASEKPKRRLVDGSSSQPPRRCSHCGVQKTPQWRTGPNGAKTLCNACGVRYKSGRLLPEYRPACSPTFSSELHSNHHRKVLEMRKKKDVTGVPEPGLTRPPVVPSFG